MVPENRVISLGKNPPTRVGHGFRDTGIWALNLRGGASLGAHSASSGERAPGASWSLVTEGPGTDPVLPGTRSSRPSRSPGELGTPHAGAGSLEHRVGRTSGAGGGGSHSHGERVCLQFSALKGEPVIWQAPRSTSAERWTRGSPSSPFGSPLHRGSGDSDVNAQPPRFPSEPSSVGECWNLPSRDLPGNLMRFFTTSRSATKVVSTNSSSGKAPQWRPGDSQANRWGSCPPVAAASGRIRPVVSELCSWLALGVLRSVYFCGKLICMLNITFFSSSKSPSNETVPSYFFL